MSESHDYDLLTGWCKRCGVSAQQAVDSGLGCIEESENVTAISHLVRGSKMQQIAASILLDRRGFSEPDDSA